SRLVPRRKSRQPAAAASGMAGPSGSRNGRSAAGRLMRSAITARQGGTYCRQRATLLMSASRSKSSAAARAAEPSPTATREAPGEERAGHGAGRGGRRVRGPARRHGDVLGPGGGEEAGEASQPQRLERPAARGGRGREPVPVHEPEAGQREAEEREQLRGAE